MVLGRTKSYSVATNSRFEDQRLRREEKAVRKAYRHERNAASYLSEDEHLGSWKVQLNKIGLELRDITPDGALADQLDGVTNNHLRYRSEVCKYMADHQDDFAPFVDDGVSFDKYMSELRKPGTFAGNDALVAFSKLYNVTIVIHMLDNPAFRIESGGTSSSAEQRELHLTYHNGEHYSSVRRIGDKSSSPAHIRTKVKAEKDCNDNSTLTEDDKVEQIMRITTCQDRAMVTQCLLDFEGDVELTTDHIHSLILSGIGAGSDNSSNGSMAVSTQSDGSMSTIDSGVWSETTTSSATSSTTNNSQSGESTQFKKKLTKADRKKEKKKRAEERRKGAVGDGKNAAEDIADAYEITCQMGLLSV